LSFTEGQTDERTLIGP